jgi:DnaJ-class molecular chaperone
VASEDSDSEVQAPASHGPRECMACRGTGQLISNLGGTPSTLTCPWCAGSGERVPGIDAQERWLAKDGEGAAEPDSPDEPAA